jgi:uncharacterized membrane protein YgdD (TMEM256/DUF423 family)
MSKGILLTASIFGALAVVFGAFGAHGLKRLIDPDALDIWSKGVEYQFYHTGALLILSQFKPAKLIILAAWSFALGIILFSGSLYLLATKALTGLSFVNYVGPVTPIGGLLMITGWMLILLYAVKKD